eukprot:6863324-Prorocentrum_lima.AAC.1
MTSSLVGSEMCIRDRICPRVMAGLATPSNLRKTRRSWPTPFCTGCTPVSYTHLTLPTICSV